MSRRVELRVSDGEAEILVYTFESSAEAGEMIHFLADFFPRGRFVVQPLSH